MGFLESIEFEKVSNKVYNNSYTVFLRKEVLGKKASPVVMVPGPGGLAVDQTSLIISNILGERGKGDIFIVDFQHRGKGLLAEKGTGGDIETHEKEMGKYIEMFRKLGLKVRQPYYQISDIAELLWPKNTFDFIIDHLVLVHPFLHRKWPGVKRVLSEYFRVLKPDGKIIFMHTGYDFYESFIKYLSQLGIPHTTIRMNQQVYYEIPSFVKITETGLLNTRTRDLIKFDQRLLGFKTLSLDYCSEVYRIDITKLGKRLLLKPDFVRVTPYATIVGKPRRSIEQL